MNGTSSLQPARFPPWSGLVTLGLLALVAGCQPFRNGTADLTSAMRPSNDRNWTPDLQRLPGVGFSGDLVTVHNIRYCEYVTGTDYTVEWFDRTFRMDQIRSADFLVVPFRNTPAIAHTMLSFGLDDGTWLCVSAEIRREIGEKYSTLAGMTNRFELVYVVADERDLIRLRTRHREADVYVYPTVAGPEQAQRLFVQVAGKVNHLQTNPEFYHTLTNNCTTSIQRQVNQVAENRVPFAWQVLLPGHSARYAWQLGLLDKRVPFDELTRLAHVNDLADRHYDDPEFSRRIRQRHARIGQLAAQATAEGTAAESTARDLAALNGPGASPSGPATGRMATGLAGWWRGLFPAGSAARSAANPGTNRSEPVRER